MAGEQLSWCPLRHELWKSLKNNCVAVNLLSTKFLVLKRGAVLKKQQLWAIVGSSWVKPLPTSEKARQYISSRKELRFRPEQAWTGKISLYRPRYLRQKLINILPVTCIGD